MRLSVDLILYKIRCGQEQATALPYENGICGFTTIYGYYHKD